MEKVVPTLKRRLFQLLISRLDGPRIRSDDYSRDIINLAENGIGGFIIFGGRLDEVREFIAVIQSRSEIPLFIASDIERGVGQQIEGGTNFPCPMAMAAAINPGREDEIALLKRGVAAIASEALDVGINMALMPVVDVNQRADNPIVCTRAFSDDPSIVAQFGAAYVSGLEAQGLIACPKHFPGHGDTAVDSHLDLPVITKPLADLSAIDLEPFRHVIRAGARSVMVGHLRIPALDSVPATLSFKAVSGLLRRDLGFKGLVLTDALTMDALKGMDNIAARCLEAGVTVLLHPRDPRQIVTELLEAVESGSLSHKTIDRALNLVYLAKQGLPLPKPGAVDHGRNRRLATSLFERAVTLLSGPVAPLPPFSDIHLVLAGDDSSSAKASLQSAFGAVSRLEETDETLGSATVFAIFSSVSAWRGTSGIAKEAVAKIADLMAWSRRSIVISFGSPYVLAEFPGAEMLIAAYDSLPVTQETVVACLRGELPFRGCLPLRHHAF